MVFRNGRSYLQFHDYAVRSFNVNYGKRVKFELCVSNRSTIKPVYWLFCYIIDKQLKCSDNHFTYFLENYMED